MSISPDFPGASADEIPYGYSMYRSVWDDKSGYRPIIVGHETQPNGRQMIMIALAPAIYVHAMLVSAGQDVNLVSPEIEQILGELTIHQRSAERAEGGVPPTPQ